MLGTPGFYADSALVVGRTHPSSSRMDRESSAAPGFAGRGAERVFMPATWVDQACLGDCLQDCGDVCGGSAGAGKAACVAECRRENDECRQSCTRPGQPPPPPPPPSPLTVTSLCGGTFSGPFIRFCGFGTDAQSGDVDHTFSNVSLTCGLAGGAARIVNGPCRGCVSVPLFDSRSFIVATGTGFCLF